MSPAKLGQPRPHGLDHGSIATLEVWRPPSRKWWVTGPAIVAVQCCSSSGVPNGSAVP